MNSVLKSVSNILKTAGTAIAKTAPDIIKTGVRVSPEAEKIAFNDSLRTLLKNNELISDSKAIKILGPGDFSVAIGNTKKVFSSLSDASRFLQNQIDTIPDLKTFIRRGGEIVENGKFSIKIMTQNSDPKIYNSLDEAITAFNKNQDEIINTGRNSASFNTAKITRTIDTTSKPLPKIPVSFTKNTDFVVDTTVDAVEATKHISRTRKLLNTAGKSIAGLFIGGLAGFTGYQISKLDTKISGYNIKSNVVDGSEFNSKEYIIVNIEIVDEFNANITFEPSENICKGDTITIYNNTTSIKNEINKSFIIQKIIEKGIFSILLSSLETHVLTKKQYGKNLGNLKLNVSDICTSALKSQGLDVPQPYIPTQDDILNQETDSLILKQQQAAKQNELYIVIGVIILFILVLMLFFSLFF